MRKKFMSKFLIFMIATIMASYGSLSANAAVMDDSFAPVSYSNDGIFGDLEDDNDSDLPSSYSSVEAGYVSEIKNQLYNDCWAYAGLACFESKILRSGYTIDSMSVDHLNLWATSRSNGTGWQRKYYGDGYTFISLGYLTAWQGGIEKNICPDFNFNKILFGDMVPTDMTRYGTTAIRYLTEADHDVIKKAIMDNGGVFTSYASANNCYSSDYSSYFMPQAHNGAYAGHSIEIVGWDDNYSRKNFNGSIGIRPKKDGAWLVKNSWGNYNELNGYFWMSYEDKFVFGNKYDPSFTVENIIKINDNLKLVQNEIFGATYSFEYINNNNITYINRFDFEPGYDKLDKIIFESRSIGADYKVYYIPVKNDSPVSDTNKWVLLDSGTLDYSGYICCDIDNYQIPDADGALGVSIDTTNTSSSNNIGVGEWLVKSDGELTFVNDSKNGDSYIFCNNQMTDLMDWYKVNNNDDMGGTFVIKAITRKPLLGDANLDGSVDIRDATEIKKEIAELTAFNKGQFENADFNDDLRVDIIDATEIQKYIVNK